MKVVGHINDTVRQMYKLYRVKNILPRLQTFLILNLKYTSHGSKDIVAIMWVKICYNNLRL